MRGKRSEQLVPFTLLNLNPLFYTGQITSKMKVDCKTVHMKSHSISSHIKAVLRHYWCMVYKDTHLS